MRCGCCTPRLHAQAVRPFVSGNKTDVTDARAIWLAVQQPGTRLVGVKSLAQQATLTLHRQRELLVKVRTMQVHALRGLLYAFGAVFAPGKKALLGEVEVALNALAGKLPQTVVDSLREQVGRIKALSEDIGAIEQRLGLQLREDPDMGRIARMPGVGLLTDLPPVSRTTMKFVESVTDPLQHGWLHLDGDGRDYLS